MWFLENICTKVGAFMALSKEKFHLRTEHSKLLGYWTVELGGLNQVSKGRISLVPQLAT